eukprot:GFKZ01002019.1.p1 GENE.GFKZ01002019.1~~GFKZ01002019.1.p1  ORF type:complete len:589 (-),score=85.10 GFKZ01002019.1:684-2450(-)
MSRPNDPTSPRPSRRFPRKSRLLVPADDLLTFTPYTPSPSTPPSPPRRRRPTVMPSLPRHRESFVQANHRFFVDPTYAPGYQQCTALPDALVPWEAVDVVCVDKPPQCPICLQEDLRSPMVTRCGHIFDYVCILQHLQHSADANGVAKCPLCFSRLRREDLRACAFYTVDVLEMGVPFAMQLLTREKGFMLPRLCREGCRDGGGSIGTNGDASFYGRFAFADDPYLLRLFQRAMDDLRQVVKEEPALQPFVNDGLAQLKAKKNAVKARRAAMRRAAMADWGVDRGDEAKGKEGDAAALVSHRFFYQAVDTRNVFLHPVNHRCLSVEFGGDFSRAPRRIEGVVVEIERRTMEETTRKKYRFLEHLPDGCEFIFVELDLTSILSSDTLEAKEAELCQRKAARKRKEVQAKKEDRQLEKRQTESLHEYFNTQAGRLARPLPRNESVDSRDVRSFPALQTDISHADDDVKRVEANVTEDEAGSSFTTPGSAWGGAEVSSYSSVTSNMGLFPSLSRSPGSSSQHVVGDAGSSLAASQAGARELKGAWGSASSGPSGDVGGVPRAVQKESRKGKRGHGKAMIVMSNAGTPNRRQ